ncbi:MAG TPA: alkaline phosphatase PhoX [Solimonas sp.]|nr:alkaline phosphatase PhoX [Solimonas sp.]
MSASKPLLNRAAPTGLRRREFLQSLFFAAGAVGVGGLAACSSNGGGGAGSARGRFASVGPLGEPNELGIRLPAGFSTRIVAIANEAPVAGATPWHIFPDGGGVMAKSDGGWYYISNSEVPGIGSIGSQFPALAPLSNALEQLVPGLGGSGVLEFAADGTLTDSYRILGNTTFNCAGCVTPWNTWLSCEEFPEGQVWEADPTGREAAVARPTLGFFSHEATAVDVPRRCIYMTEDLPDSRFYRWVADAGDWPAGAARPALQSGRLQVLKVLGEGVEAALARPQPVQWVDADAPDAPQDQHRIDGTAAFDGGEGLWIHGDYVYFSTKGDNRIWVYDRGQETLEVIYDLASSDNPILSGVDNLTVTSRGDLLVAEDGGDMQIVVILPDRSLKPLLQITGQDASEIAGIAFSPDGRRLYFTSDRGGPQPGGGYGIGFGITYELLLPPGI